MHQYERFGMIFKKNQKIIDFCLAKEQQTDCRRKAEYYNTIAERLIAENFALLENKY